MGNFAVRLTAACGWLLCVVLSSGCDGATGNIHATDPTERGLSYVAAAIITAAFIRGFMNK